MTKPTNPFAALEERVKRERLERDGATMMSNTRSILVLGHDSAHYFFAGLAMKLDLVPDWDIKTCSTNGVVIKYNPAFISAKPIEESIFIMGHEVWHCAAGHHARRGARDPELWNIACDLATNPILVDSKIGTMPREAIYPGVGEYGHLPRGLSAEEYYTRLQQPGEGGGGEMVEPWGKPSKSQGDGQGDESQQDGQGDGQGNDPGQCGGVEDPGDGSDSARRQSEADWQENVAQAAQLAKQRGELPGDLEDLIKARLTPKVDWRHQLREFLCRHAKNDFSWANPNRRFLHIPLYLPGMQSEELGHLVIHVDASGSCWDVKYMTVFAGEVQGVLDTFDCEVTLIYHDSKVQRVETWKSTDGVLTLKPKGGGGTSHVPSFDYVDKHNLDPVCAICLTDCETTYPKDPGYPVLWACVGNPNARPPFGTLIHVEL